MITVLVPVPGVRSHALPLALAGSVWHTCSGTPVLPLEPLPLVVLPLELDDEVLPPLDDVPVLPELPDPDALEPDDEPELVEPELVEPELVDAPVDPLPDPELVWLVEPVEPE